jgi:hypothetical protein
VDTRVPRNRHELTKRPHVSGNTCVIVIGYLLVPTDRSPGSSMPCSLSQFVSVNSSAMVFEYDLCIHA